MLYRTNDLGTFATAVSALRLFDKDDAMFQVLSNTKDGYYLSFLRTQLLEARTLLSGLANVDEVALKRTNEVDSAAQDLTYSLDDIHW